MEKGSCELGEGLGHDKRGRCSIEDERGSEMSEVFDFSPSRLQH